MTNYQKKNKSTNGHHSMILFVCMAVLFACNAYVLQAQQRYSPHITSSSRNFIFNDYSIDAIGPYYEGIVSISKKFGITCFFLDSLCRQVGAANLLLKGVGGHYPQFYKGEVAMVLLYDGNEIASSKGAIINTKGEVLKTIPNCYWMTDAFDETGVGIVMVADPKGTRNYFINEKGERIYSHLSRIAQGFDDEVLVYPLVDGIRRYYDSEKGQYGYINSNGKIVIPVQFSKAHDFSEGLAAVETDSGWGFIDAKGNSIIKPTLSNEPGDFHDGLAVVEKRNGTYAYIDRECNIVSDSYWLAGKFFNGFALIGKKGDSNLYIVNTSFELVRRFNDSECIKYNDYDKSFYSTKRVYYPDGTIKLDISDIPGGKFLYERPFVRDYAIFTSDKYTGYINTKGEILFILSESEL